MSVNPMYRFCDLPLGTRIKYPGHDSVWVVIDVFGDGTVAQEVKIEDIEPGSNLTRQSLCCFADGDDYTMESLVEVVG